MTEPRIPRSRAEAWQRVRYNAPRLGGRIRWLAGHATTLAILLAALLIGGGAWAVVAFLHEAGAR